MAVLVAGLILAACSTMDSVGETISDVAGAANPVNWFGGDDTEKKADDKSGISRPEEKSSYPNLASVPERPKTSTVEQRLIIEEGLRADRENARYAAGPPPKLYPQLIAPRSDERSVSESPVPPAGQQAAVPAGEEVKIVTVRFAEDSAALPKDTLAYLREVVGLRQRQGGTLKIVGHTSKRRRDEDPEKDRMAKFDLSLARANAVADALVSLGAPRDRLVVEARGDAEPAAPSGGGAGAERNSRVEVFLERGDN